MIFTYEEFSRMGYLIFTEENSSTKDKLWIYEMCIFHWISGPRLGYLFLLLMLYGWTVIPLMYLFSFVFRTASTAFVVLTMFNIITGLATLLSVFILSIPGNS